ncbi:hypothetical protein BJX61DRAFT_542364 [Aspergillus egyptiacus]|nr:hypothetical protein BJX61DRAFT_542364 [Aspergillus egyptiacus]
MNLEKEHSSGYLGRDSHENLLPHKSQRNALVGPNWPNYGKFDAIENVNTAITNRMTLRTTEGYSIATNSNAGAVISSDCAGHSTQAPQPTKAATAVQSNPQAQILGFISIGGGVYAT